MMKRDILVLVFVIGICFGCSDYTTTQLDDHAVVSGATPVSVVSYMYFFSICKLFCNSPSPVCTVSHDPDDNKCYVYSTNCGGTCSTEPSSGWTVYTTTCIAVECPALSDPPNGVADTSAGTSSGDQATYTCNIGYLLFGWSVTTCGSDGNWDNAAPTCSIVDCGALSNPADGTVSFTYTTYGSQANYGCITGYSLSGSSVRTCGSDGNWGNSGPTCSPVDCDTLADPVDGTVSLTLTTYGSQANYDCNIGYTLSGSSLTTCGSDGNWDYSAPTCTLVDCGSLTNPSFGSVKYTNSTYGAQANYACDTGYSITGSNSRSCLSNGTWELMEPECVSTDCGLLTDPVHGSVHTPAGTTFGKTATFSCDSGYALSHAAPRKCQATSKWTGTSPTCNLAECPALSDPTNGVVDTSAGHSSGDQAMYTCNIGYILFGSSVTTCNSDGNWDNSMPTCSFVDCGSLSNPTDGTVSFTLTTYGSRANYDCNTGYVLSGSSIRMCGFDGNWDNSAPTCSLIDCGSPSDPTDGKVSSTTTTYGSQANYDCNTGYSLSGSSVRTCGSDGNWNNAAPTCSLVDCGSISNPIDGTVSFTTTTYGSQANYDCNTGYSLSGSSVRTCGSDGNWTNSAPTCSLVDCGSLSNQTDGIVSFVLTTYGSQANYDCNTGYSLNGSSVRACDSDGNWDNSAPICTPVDCGSLTNPVFGSVTYTETTYGAQANYTCNSGFSLTGSNSRSCLSNGTWESMEPECVSTGATTTTTAAPLQKKLYIMPCICYTNKTFVNMTQDEIIQQLIADTKIDTKETSLAQYKLKSRSDPRMSSKMIGMVAIVVLSVIGGLILFCDILTMRATLRSLEA